MSPATAVRSVNDLGLGLLRQPRQVLFGPGQRRQLPEVVAAIGRTVLVVTDERMATTAEFGELVAGLRDRGLAVAVYDRTEAELPRENVVELVDRFAGESVDVLVGIGGGSCMDLAKVAS
ncbi:MAG: iron-containing alcohol dehydrogenase, partial [Microbacterium sp.]|nr:iron-containing alcohol dehydrogenase [Microbacterium sp.]